MAWCLIKYRDNFTFSNDTAQGRLAGNTTQQKEIWNHQTIEAKRTLVVVVPYNSEIYIYKIKCPYQDVDTIGTL
jgi:hypothetical protein